jgi:hypothetical protein
VIMKVIKLDQDDLKSSQSTDSFQVFYFVHKDLKARFGLLRAVRLSLFSHAGARLSPLVG